MRSQRNSSDLIERIKSVNNHNKIVSFDVTSLFTNVPVDGALKAVRKVIRQPSDEHLLLWKSGYVKLVELCVKIFFFSTARNTGKARDS